ncbi:hypothetical protein SAPIO_CDS10221 [Scedosporium apiospermum]|uniref:Large ribosomal subunit protein mL49 n=1 Tax=Pseudallescheria apiosperma TaxID=563466 RepID=A0A084FUZ0_PSEDA|nr:uncharacterized protein SAPIO_CDS10221 [Scedosporium apiospermum]KEZ38902.1 hypothetical protein SAPIO_CDS10221 [Scedosporium apiospermum]
MRLFRLAQTLPTRLPNLPIRLYATESLTIPSSTTTATSSAATSATTTSTPYLVSRTKSNRLPVYLRIQAGGSKRTTLIRRIDGDALALKADVQEALGVDKADVSLNPVTGHVVVKGSHVPSITEWLKTKGF